LATYLRATRKASLIIDTNVFVSGFLFEESVPGSIVTFTLTKARLLHSYATFTELSEVLSRPKFDRYLSREVRDLALDRISWYAEFIEDLPKIEMCRDPKDDKFLELALGGDADYLVTGDDDLLMIGQIGRTMIIKPNTFLEAILGKITYLDL
jgi:uncharacterized protein